MPSDSNGQTVWISHLYLNLQCFKWSTGFQSFPPSQLVPKLLCSIHASNTNLPPPCCSLSLSHRSSLHTISSIKSSLSSYVGKCKARCSLFLSFSFSFSLHLRWHRLLWKCVDANPFFSLSLSLSPSSSSSSLFASSSSPSSSPRSFIVRFPQFWFIS